MDSQALDGRKPDRIEVELHSGSLAIVTLIGEHDLGRYEAMKEALETAAIRRDDLIVDLSPCAFFDSTTVTLLLHTQGEVVTDSGQFAVVVPLHEGPVARTADMMRLAELFPLYATLPDAIAALAHVLRIRDLCVRLGDPEAYAAECSCGWKGEPQSGLAARGRASHDATSHRRASGPIRVRPSTRS